MVADLPVTGISDNRLSPITAIEILLGMGPSTAGGGDRYVCFVAPMSAAGSWTANTTYEVKSESVARDGGGPGSPAHRAARFALKAGIKRFFVLPYAETVGTGADSADGTIVVTGTATAPGFVEFDVQEEEFKVSWATGATATAIGDVIEDVINGRDWLACDASNSTGTVTLEAKIAGKSQGDGTTGVIRFRVKSYTTGVGITVAAAEAALGLTPGAPGAEGATTTEVAALTAALATLDATCHYYLVITAWEDTAIAALTAHILAKSLPAKGLRSVGIAGNTGALGTLQTQTIAENYERYHVVWQRNSDHDVAALVGNFAAVIQVIEEYDDATALDFFSGNTQVKWLIKPAYAQADWPDGDELEDAATDGITAIASNDIRTYINMFVNSRSKDSTGLIDDFRAVEPHRRAVMDRIASTLQTRHQLYYAGLKLKPDEKLYPDQDASLSNVNSNQKHRKGVITPATYAPFVYDLIDEFDDNNQLKNIADTKAKTIIQIAPGNTARLQIAIPAQVIDLCHQMSAQLIEDSEG